jgi:hypothetical protein
MFKKQSTANVARGLFIKNGPPTHAQFGSLFSVSAGREIGRCNPAVPPIPRSRIGGDAAGESHSLPGTTLRNPACQTDERAVLSFLQLFAVIVHLLQAACLPFLHWPLITICTRKSNRVGRPMPNFCFAPSVFILG